MKHKRSRVELTESRKSIERRMCEWCKESLSDIRYSFYTKHANRSNCFILNHVCSPLCGSKQLEHRVSKFNEYYFGLWRNGRNG